jgi:hypothetical protein
MIVMVILTVGLLKQLRLEPRSAGRSTQVVPAPARHEPDAAGPPVPAAAAAGERSSDIR